MQKNFILEGEELNLPRKFDITEEAQNMAFIWLKGCEKDFSYFWRWWNNPHHVPGLGLKVEFGEMGITFSFPDTISPWKDYPEDTLVEAKSILSREAHDFIEREGLCLSIQDSHIIARPFAGMEKSIFDPISIGIEDGYFHAVIQVESNTAYRGIRAMLKFAEVIAYYQPAFNVNLPVLRELLGM